MIHDFTWNCKAALNFNIANTSFAQTVSSFKVQHTSSFIHESTEITRINSQKFNESSWPVVCSFRHLNVNWTELPNESFLKIKTKCLIPKFGFFGFQFLPQKINMQRLVSVEIYWNFIIKYILVKIWKAFVKQDFNFTKLCKITSGDSAVEEYSDF